MRWEPIRRVTFHVASERMGVKRRITELRFQFAERQNHSAALATTHPFIKPMGPYCARRK